MKQYKTFAPLDTIPAHFLNALQEALSGLVDTPLVQIKPGATNTLQVPAGPGDGRVTVPIQGHWRYIDAPVEAAGGGGAGLRDVYVTAADNSYSSGSVTVGGTTYPEEVDGTDYSFGLVIVASGGTPSGVALYRRVAVATWDGAKFVAVAPVVGATALVPPPQLVTGLPPNPVDGQEIYLLADATHGVVWHLRYRAASSSPWKWEAVGAQAPLRDAEDVLIQVSSTTFPWSFGSSSHPVVVPPLSGDYLVSFGATVLEDVDASTSGQVNFQMAVAIGAVATPPTVGGPAAAFDTALFKRLNFNPTQVQLGGSVERTDVPITLNPGGQNVRPIYQVPSWDVNITDRWVAVRPVRVG